MHTRSSTRFVSSLPILCLAAAVAVSAAIEEPEDLSDSEDPGRDAWVLPDQMGTIYEAQCAVCHGPNLEGAAQGPGLLDELTHGASVPELVASISKGSPAEGMPAWAGIIPDEDIRGVSIYILEKREGETRDERSGLGELPTLPDGPITSELHGFTIRNVRGGIVEPYSIAALPDGRLLLTEKMRGISIISADGKTSTLITGTPKIYDDSRLRGNTYTGNGWAHEVAVHPDYEENGWIYFSYGDRCQDCTEESRETGQPATMLKLVRGRLEGNRWVDQETIWEAPKSTYIVGMENGAGARITFDDKGYVYLSLGVFSDYRRVQDLAFPQGKILRIYADGRTPTDNPFVAQENALPQIFSIGHRNPQGLDWDPKTQLLWSFEHGPRGGDEGNIIRPGNNYGWPLVSLGVDYDGRPIRYAKEFGIEFDPADLTPPIIDFTPSPGVSSIVFYRGDAFPEWRDDLIVATLGGNDLLRFEVDENGASHSEILIESFGRFRDVEVGPNGELLLLVEHRKGSMILRIDPLKS